MLQWATGRAFSVGRAKFADHLDAAPQLTAKIFVRIKLPSMNYILPAQLDTGGAWSVLEVEVAEALSLLNGDGYPVELRTRNGMIKGRLERTQIQIVADEGQGRSLDTEATFFVSPEWTGHTFLGYANLLDHIRFAIDPGENFFYFDIASPLAP